MRLLSLPVICAAAVLCGCDQFLGAPPKAASISIEQEPITLAENEWVALKAVVRDGNGAPMPDVPVWWTSRDFYVASIVDQEAPGVYANSVGSTVIEAHAEGKVATVPVTVTRGVVKSVYVNPNRFVILPGQRVQLYPVAQDAAARGLHDRAATYTANDTFSRVTPQGEVFGLAPGLSTITVSVEGVSATVPLQVIAPIVSFDFYKRGGTATPGTATLAFAPQDVYRGFLSIDGRTLPMNVFVNYGQGVVCMVNQAGGVTPADAVTRCVFDATPLAIRLCTSIGVSDPGQLQYVLMPKDDPARIPATASALLAAVQSNTTLLGINVYSDCTSGAGLPGATYPPRWVRNAPDTDFYLWPNTSTVHSAASVSARLDGAAIFSAPGAGNEFRKYLAVRVSATMLEVWH